MALVMATRRAAPLTSRRVRAAVVAAITSRLARTSIEIKIVIAIAIVRSTKVPRPKTRIINRAIGESKVIY